MRTGSLVSICQDSGNWEPDIPTCDEGIAVYTLLLHIKIINCYSFVVYIFKGIFSISCQKKKLVFNCFSAVTCSAIVLENGEVTYTTTQINVSYVPLNQNYLDLVLQLVKHLRILETGIHRYQHATYVIQIDLTLSQDIVYNLLMI